MLPTLSSIVCVARLFAELFPDPAFSYEYVGHASAYPFPQLSNVFKQRMRLGLVYHPLCFPSCLKKKL